METIQHVLRLADTNITNRAALVIDEQARIIQEQQATIKALNDVIGLAGTTTENIMFAVRIRQKALEDAAKVVLSDLVNNPTTAYQAQYNRGLATTAHAIRNLK